MIYIYLAIIAFALWGIGITVRIYREKRKGGPMVCPLGADCKEVVTSEFSSFLGIGLEIFGILYYLLILISYTILLLFPQIFNDFAMFVLTGFTIGAFLFSLYLTFVQAFYLKSWCTWCLISAGVSTTIFTLSTIGLFVSDFKFIPIFELLAQPIMALHLVGFALGVGGITVSSILFFRFLKDFKISPSEDKVLKTISQVVWLGLFLVILSGIGLYVPKMEMLNESPVFLVKMVVVLIIILNGAFLDLVISPKLIKISFKGSGLVSKIQRMRSMAFASGAVALVSWYSAFILGTIENIPLSTTHIFSIYFALIVLAIIFSQVAEKLLSSKRK